jgi:hypothetical protein
MFEYRFVVNNGFALEKVKARTLAEMNALGAQGWRLVTVSELYYVFERYTPPVTPSAR